jgi:hypothetical protein
MRGAINQADRMQRLVVGGLLILLTGFGIQESSDWTRWFALAIQFELFATVIVGWCPFYWSLGGPRVQ